MNRKMIGDSHERWKCADPELERQIRCFPYGERSDFPQLQQVEQKAVGRQRNLGLGTKVTVCVSTGTLIPDPPFSSFGPSRDYGMDLSLKVYL
jgi:hypothetical protein